MLFIFAGGRRREQFKAGPLSRLMIFVCTANVIIDASVPRRHDYRCRWALSRADWRLADAGRSFSRRNYRARPDLL